MHPATNNDKLLSEIKLGRLIWQPQFLHKASSSTFYPEKSVCQHLKLIELKYWPEPRCIPRADRNDYKCFFFFLPLHVFHKATAPLLSFVFIWFTFSQKCQMITKFFIWEVTSWRTIHYLWSLEKNKTTFIMENYTV